MRKASLVLTAVVALEHLYFLVLEMFLWTKPIGLETFHSTQEFADASAVLASNQGLYNGFLAAGLLWSFAYPEAKAAANIRIFFLACVCVAGLFGGVTVGPMILFVQALPAVIALGLVVAS